MRGWEGYVVLGFCWLLNALGTRGVESCFRERSELTADASYRKIGKLILNLTKDSYEQLGLSGKPSTFHQDRQRYGMGNYAKRINSASLTH